MEVKYVVSCDVHRHFKDVPVIMISASDGFLDKVRAGASKFRVQRILLISPSQLIEFYR